MRSPRSAEGVLCALALVACERSTPAPGDRPSAQPSAASIEPSAALPPPWRFPADAGAPRASATPPSEQELESARGNRCAEGSRRELFVLGGGRLLRRMPAEGRVRLSALLPELPSALSLTVWPCVGEPRRFSAQELRADEARFTLRAARKGFFKLEDAVGAKELFRNVAAVTLSAR